MHMQTFKFETTGTAGMAEVDAVIVGAGVNGLAAAAHLGQRGWSVAVVETAEVPGGAARSSELTLPGFVHDWGAMNLSLFAGSGFHKAHGATLAAHGLAFAPAVDCFATAFPDGTWCGVSTDLATTQARIAAFSPRDAEVWGALVAAFPERAQTLFAILGSRLDIRALARIGWDALRRHRLQGGVEILRFLLKSPRTWLGETFESPRVQAMLGAWGMHLDFAPDIAGGALFPYLEGMASQSFGMVIGRGGAGTMVRALTGMIEGAGGSVRCGQAVTRIETAGGRASGVVLADGTRIAARRAVIATVAPGALPALVDGGLGPAAFTDRLRRFRHGPGTMMIHLALDGLPDWAAGTALQRFAYVHLAPSLDQMARTYAQAMAGDLPDEPVIVVGQPTAIDPTRAPEGKHVLWIQVRVLPADPPGGWDAQGNTYADRILAIIDRYAPGIAGKVLARAVHSPADLARWNVNLVGGDQICGSHHLDQNFLFRPGWDTPIKNLHLAGAATWPGAGVGAGSGYMLAQALAGR